MIRLGTSILCLLLFAWPFKATAGSSFSYDRQLVIQLAIAYTGSEFRQSPKSALPGIDYRRPDVIAIRDRVKRKLIFVSFASTKSSQSSGGVWGVVAAFQVCGEPRVMRLIDVYAVDPIESERADDAKADGSDFANLPDVCPKLDE
jgi:hypothetical protein